MYDAHLDCFLMVADYGSFSKAAEKLYISPNAVIKQVNLLEYELGVTLFNRSNKGVTLTEAGKSIYQSAKRIIRISQQAIETAKNIEKVSKQSIRIGTSLLRPCKTIIDLWIPISEKYPDIKLQVIPFDDDTINYFRIVENLGKDIDIIAGIYPSTLWNNRCQALEITQIPICCAVPRKHHLAENKIISFKDLYEENLIMVERGDTKYIDSLRDEIEKNHPQIHIINVPTYDAKIFNKSEIMNAPIISIKTWEELHPSLVTIPCDWSYTVPYGILYPLHPSDEILKFLEIIKKEAYKKL